MPAIDTPCINICTLDPHSGLCLGCGRTLEEIAHWSACSNEERRRVMALLAERLRALGDRRSQRG
jgi:uncharacterized protein